MATKIKTISILFGTDCVDRASVTFSNVERVNGEWLENDEKPQSCTCANNTLTFEFESKTYAFTFDLIAVLGVAKKLAASKPKWQECAGESHFWYAYSAEDSRLEVPCSIKEGQWSLKVGLKTTTDPNSKGKKSAIVTGLLNFRRCKPMTIEF